jgi:hypothetical protein
LGGRTLEGLDEEEAPRREIRYFRERECDKLIWVVLCW